MAVVHLGRKRFSALLAIGIDGYAIRLLQTLPPTPDGSEVWADAVEADFSGYAAMTWDSEPPATLNAAFKGVTPVVLVSFTHDGGPTANSVLGWAVTYAAEGGPELQAWGEFDDPQDMTDLGDEINLRLKLTLTQDDT